MAVANRPARACEVCGCDRARWYCAADEAYLCECCDRAVHGANALALRHERVRLAFNGVPMKMEHRDVAFSKIRNQTVKKRSTKSCQLLRGSSNIHVTRAQLNIQTSVDEESELHVRDSQVKIEPCVVVGHSTDCSNLSGPFVYSSTLEPSTSIGASAASDFPEEFLLSDEMEPDPGSTGGILSSNTNGIMGSVIEEILPDMQGLDTLSPAVFVNRGSSHEDYVIHVADGVPLRGDISDGQIEDDSVGNCLPFLFRCGKEKVERKLVSSSMLNCSLDGLKDDLRQVPSLRLNYADVMSAWSDRGTLWTGDDNLQTVPDQFSSTVVESSTIGLVPDLNAGNDEQAVEPETLSLPEDNMMNIGGAREARVMRYREKRRTRLFSKKIRYEVRKLNAERRPRMKGRFIKRASGREDSFLKI